MSHHAQTVAAIYEAFGRGDVEAILSRLADDVRWEEWDDNHAQRAHVPWLAPRSGREGAAEFLRVAGGLQIHDFRVLKMLAGEDSVAAEVVIEFTAPNGARLRDEELHLWDLGEDGKVVRMRHYVDTAKHIAVAAANA
ncbi:MAG TPA: nuclear transport factor 2 family protein [Thermoanaerobaculia bacterium]|nr:nuclear transport factor 2 family protein [Thermoanaerobaculia bacterium]